MPETDMNARLRDAILALKKVRAERDALQRARSEPIAILGMGCRFPGGATSPEAFWRALEARVDAVTEVPAERWRLDRRPLGAEEPAARAVRWGAFLRDVDLFEPQFFGIAPREATSLDPQQRLMLEVAWEALENAGQVPEHLARTRTGVFIGLMTNDYALISGALDPDVHDVYAATGNGHCFPAGRLSYTLGLQGPSMTVDTACSSSLVALHLACQSLRSRESDLALTGGVNLMLSPSTTQLIATTGTLSPDGRCRTFDAQASGIVRGEGCGMLVLKRLSDAQRDGDPVLAVILGSTVNQDGRSTSLTAPSVLAQRAMLREALERAGVSAADIGYIEAHGTGTPLGDPIEVEALAQAIGAPREDGYVCALGAVKTNIGHLEAAAGVAGVIKAVLAIQRRTIPANIHFKTQNPRINLEGTPFVIPTRAMAWPAAGRRRTAGVSSFGLSGTNAHVVLAEPPDDPPPAPVPERSCYLLPLSAKSGEALTALASATSERLKQGDASLHDIAYTASTRRGHHEHRLSVVGRSSEQIAASIEALLRGDPVADIARGRAPQGEPPKVVFVFPGQGSQWPGMGRELRAEEPAFRAALEACDAAIRAEAGFSVVEEIAADEGRSRLAQIDIVQPSLFAVEVALAALWRSWGIEPAVVVGHSMGEIAAAHVAGALSLDDAARIVCRRSRLLRRLSGRGAMASVALSMQEAEAALVGHEDRLSVAVSNGPRSTVLSGNPEALSEVLAGLERKGVFCRRIKVDFASHGPEVDPLRGDLLAALTPLAPQQAAIPMRSTVVGRMLSGPELGAEYWVDNLRRPVLFSQAIEEIDRAGTTIFLEMSPHPLLLSSIEERSFGDGAKRLAFPSLRRGQPERQILLESLGALYAHGVAVDFPRLYPDSGRVVSLPTYPWQRRRYWADAPAGKVRTPVVSARHEALGEDRRPPDASSYDVAWRERPATARRAERPATPRRWLILADRGGVGETLAASLRGRGDSCALLRSEDRADLTARARSALASGDPISGVVHLWGLDAASGDALTPGALDPPELPLCASVAELLPCLLEAPAPPRLWLITRNAQPVAGSEVSVAQAPLWGLGRVAALEHPEAWGGLIDLGDRTDDEGALLAEALTAGDDENQIALRGARRFVARLAPSEPDAALAAVAVRPDRTYLVTGGLGGLGLAAARWLVGRGAKHLVLTSRSGVPDRSTWDAASSPAARARIDAVRSLEADGATVEVSAIDVADRSAMAALLRRLARPLAGVIHSAGSLVLQPLAAPAAVQALRDVFRAKVDGTRALHALTSDLSLDFFVMFSSAAAIWGSKNQGHYAAANHFMDAVAHARRARGLPALSLNLGAVAGGGMLTHEAEALFEALGMTAMKAEHMLDDMERALAAGVAQRTLAQVDWSMFKPAYEARASRPLLREIQAEARVDSGAALSKWEAQSALSLALARGEQLQRDIVVSYLRELIAAVLRVDRAAIEADVPLLNYGLDSFMTLDLRKRLELSLRIELSAAEIWSHGQIDRLAVLILERLDLRPAEARGELRQPAGGDPTLRSSAVPAIAAPLAAEVAAASSPAAGQWIVVPRPVADARARLLCFPYAGGGAPVYHEWPKDMPAGVELGIIAPPGRHGRLSEPLPRTVEEMVAALIPALIPYLDRPFAMFGHCLGAIVMFEVARELTAKHGLRPMHLFASGSPPPRKYLLPHVALGGRERLVELLRIIGFARSSVLDDPEALDELLPPVVGDFEMAARYRHVPASPLDVPISTFAASDDLFASPDVVEEWRAETTCRFSKSTYSGEHYFLFAERASIERAIGEELLGDLAVLEHARTSARGAEAARPARAAMIEGARPERAGGRRSSGIDVPSPRAGAARRLVCFPCAGGDASLFRSWPDALPDDIEVCAVDLPGSAGNEGELPFGRIDAMVDWVIPLLLEYLDRPFAFFGHDFGATLMYEVTCRLRRRGHPSPRHLFASAAMAPHVLSSPPFHRLSTAKLLDSARVFGAAIDAPEAEPRLRADFGALATYAHRPEPPLDTPITAFLGDRDSFVPQHGVRAWRELTTARFEARVVPGDHRFIRDERPPVLPHIVEAMNER